MHSFCKGSGRVCLGSPYIGQISVIFGSAKRPKLLGIGRIPFGTVQDFSIPGDYHHSLGCNGDSFAFALRILFKRFSFEEPMCAALGGSAWP